MSRLPPPPPGLPPRPVDSYRSGPPRNDRLENRDYDRARDRDDRQPMYQFSGNNGHRRRSRSRSPPRNGYGYDSYAPGVAATPLRSSGNVHRQQSQQGGREGLSRDFTFRVEAPPSISANNYRPTSPQPRRNNYQQNTNGYRYGHSQGQSDGRGRGGYRGRGGPRIYLASDRAFLRGNREPTPEMMPGMDEDEAGAKFKSIEDVSDSDEAEMDMSDDENGAEQPSKKARTGNKAADGDSAPKWSNPDPYTTLPPPDESLRKKKDVVKLIRKARVETNAGSSAKVDPADDFISFDFGDEEDTFSNDQDPFEGDHYSPDRSGMGVEGAPTGPRFSHAANLHKQQPRVAPAAAPPANRQIQARATNQNLQDPTNNQPVQSRVNNQSGPVQPTNQNVQVQANKQNVQVQLNIENVRPSKPVKLDTSSDPSFGSRKRNFQDQIKPAPVLHQVGRGVSKKAASGMILKQWQATADSTSTPWLEIDHPDTANMGLWLHKEIVDFYYYVKPREFEDIIRTRLVDDLRVRLNRKNEFAQADIHTFGSFPAGLYLPTADMDLVCISEDYMRTGNIAFGKNMSFYHRFSSFIRNQDLAIDGSIEMITKAKVPLVKYIDKLTGLKVDISFENTTGLVANRTFQDWKTQFPAMPVLVTLIKHLLAMRGLNEPVNGGIGGFSVTCLVVSLLQNMPQVQSGTMIPEHHFGEILMEFFDLYGNQFNPTVNAISLNPPGYLSKAQTGAVYNARNVDRLCIIDPNKPENDIAGGSANTETILRCFSKSYLDLQNRMGELQYSNPGARRNQSILDCILGGNYNSFKLQRQHLAHVYEKLYGPLHDREST